MPALKSTPMTFSNGDWNWAVIDGCAAPLLPARLLTDSDASSLYRLPRDDEYHQVAPFLVKWPPAWWPEIGGLGNLPWGITMQGPDDREAMAQHLRRMLSVKAPDGDIWLFRFYDPRVLGPFLAVCTPAELAWIFGPISRFGCPTPDGNIDTFGRDDIGWATGNVARVRLTARHSAPPTGAGPLFALREAHLEPFQSMAETGLVERVRAQIPAELVEDLEDELIAGRIKAGLARAREHYGVDAEDALTAFVLLMWEVGPSFDRQSQINRLLLGGRGDANERVLEIANRASAEAWTEAAEPGQEDDWSR